MNGSLLTKHPQLTGHRAGPTALHEGVTAGRAPRVGMSEGVVPSTRLSMPRHARGRHSRVISK